MIKNLTTLRNLKVAVGDGAVICMLDKHLPLD